MNQQPNDSPTHQNPINLSRKTTSAHFRNLTSEHFPGLDKNPAYWRFFEYLLFGTFFDDKSGKLVISQSLIAEIERQTTIRYTAETFLKRFQQDVMSPSTFEWSRWAKQRCRIVTKLLFPVEFEEAFNLEMKKHWHHNGRVYFADGKRFSKAKQKKEREKAAKLANHASRAGLCPEALGIQEYMNGLAPNLFTATLKNLPDAIYEVNQIPNERGRKIQLKYLGDIEDQPKPYYSATEKGNTVRLFGMGGCIPKLQRNVRLALTQDWAEADLRNSQLAICARLWEIDEVNQFLQKGESIWDYLFDWFPVSKESKLSIKPALKKSLYSLCYGMKLRNIKWMLTKFLWTHGIPIKGARFFEPPLIKVLAEYRDLALSNVEQQGGATTCFGKFISTDNLKACQILSQVAQALELKLLAPIFQLARKTNDFTITLWQHDGFSVNFTRRTEEWKRRISREVEGELVKHNVISNLDWK